MRGSTNHNNRLLQRLSPAELARLDKHLEPVTLSFKEPIYDRGQRIQHLYFPTSGIVSVVADLSNAETVETATIGREGLVGLPAFLGVSRAPGRAFCQIPGAAMRIRADALNAEAERGGTLGPLLLRYTNAVMAMLAQTAACNRSHTLDERMCRWLLMTRDRVDSDTFPLTQEFLATMVGVRRPSISLAGTSLQRAGLIKYSRGRITILDRPALEASSCECYAFVQKQFELALGGDGEKRRQRR
jgi:CRP-like cAMP-binding protein